MTKRRRTRGDGALYQRHDHPSCPPLADDNTRADHKCQGRWVGIAVVTIDGRKRRKAVYAKSQKAARIKLGKVLEQNKRGGVTIGSPLLSVWLDHWLTTIAGRELKPQTLTGYDSKIRTLIKPHLGHHRIDALRPEHVRHWQDTLRGTPSKRGTPLSEASIRQAHLILKSAMKAAVYDGKVPASVVELVKPPKTDQAKRKGFTIEDAGKILHAAGADARWWLAVAYGLRQGEALGLHWRDIDFNNKTLRIEQTLQMGRDRTQFFGPPKTDLARRTMPMLPFVAIRLAAHKPVGVDPDTLVFHRGDGQPIKPWDDNRAWHALLDATGVEHLPLHSARHTAASVLEAAGVPDRLVMQILGHSQVQTTHGYTHAEISRQADALQAGFDLLAIES